MYYYQHHIGDFKSATSHLDDHQLATYLRMIWACYDTEKPLSSDIEDIAFAMRTDEKTVRLLLRHFFVETPDGWVNERCQREIAAYHSKSDKARNSAKARWSNTNAMRTHNERNASEPVFDANQEPRTNNQDIHTSSSDDMSAKTVTLEQVANVYHDMLPNLPAMRMFNQKRKSMLKARIKDYPKANDLDWWKLFFEQAGQSKFLTGQVNDWKADLEFLLSPKGFNGVIEGKYK